MDKVKRIILSNYDSGYRFSIAIDDKIYTRYEIEQMEYFDPIKQIYNSITQYRYKGKSYKELIKQFYVVDEIIFCEDGDIYFDEV